MKYLIRYVASLIPFASLACSSTAPPSAGQESSADSIAPFDDPSGVVGAASRRLSDNISSQDIGQSFGTSDDRIPYPDTYWPMVENGIDAQWNGTEASPLEKYMKLADPSNVGNAQKWNRANQGKDVSGVKSWFGICNGWAAASTSELPAQHAVNAHFEGDTVSSCSSPQGDGCIKFEIGDIDALLAEVYADGPAHFIGARCDTDPQSIKRDDAGRILRDANGQGCKGLNPGSLLIVLNTVMKRQQKALVIDAQNPSNTDQIWNQPAYRYRVNRFVHLSEKEAANWVAAGNPAGNESKYRWNDAAKGWALVDITLFWVSENGPNHDYVSGLLSTRQMPMAAVVELDKPADDPDARIIGGEFVDDPTVEANRLRVPPFVWTSAGTGPEWRDPSSTTGHNPYVRPSIVLALASLAQKAL